MNHLHLNPHSQRLLVGNPARTHGPPYEFSPCTRCACCTGSTQRGGPLLASCLTHVLCTYKLLHGAWDTCLESQSPTWTSSYFEVFTLFLETLVLLATMFIFSHGSHSESWASWLGCQCSFPEDSKILCAYQFLFFRAFHFSNQGSEEGHPWSGYNRFSYTFTRGPRLPGHPYYHLNQRTTLKTLVGQMKSASLIKKYIHAMKIRHYALKEHSWDVIDLGGCTVDAVI